MRRGARHAWRSVKETKEFTMNLYIGNLSRRATDADLQQAFAAFGQVKSATIIKDKFSGESRGFGFVEMPAKAEAEAAMAGLTGKELLGQSLIVNEAHARADDRRGGERRGGGPRPH
jgi:RNA recognition motif-containing protein